MKFSNPTPKELETLALKRYLDTPRVLNDTYIGTIRWQEVRSHEITPVFLSLLGYFRDIEYMVELYNTELQKTPTGRDLVIKPFLERWGEEEILHGQLIERFLEEAGLPPNGKHLERLLASIPLMYRLRARPKIAIARIIGEGFSPVHMSWGAIQEYTTLCGYNRMKERANHPVLENLIDGIRQEEATHAAFYARIAHIRLSGSTVRQKLTRFILSTLWRPVGYGVKPTREVYEVVRFLFGDKDGVSSFNNDVTRQMARLPGLAEFRKPTEVIRRIL